MDSFLSKVFNSKRKQVYNVDKSKKQNLKKVNKNMHQMSPAVVTNKLRKEFGIYKPTSEFSTASYNIPCVPHIPYQNSIDSVDVIPHSFHQQEQNLVKCTQDQKRLRNKSLLFADENNSQTGAESINKEFGIDEYETNRGPENLPQEHGRPKEHSRTQEHGTARTQNRIVEEVKINIRKQTLNQQKPDGTKDNDETSVEESSTNTSEVRKDSLFGRYDDPCKQLNSFRCNGEFIFESRKEGNSETFREKTINDTRKLNQEVQSTSVLNDSVICSTSNERLVGEDSMKVKNQKENVEEIHDLSKFLINKKGRIKCKSPEKDKASKSKKVKGDDGISRHRNYHSMIILGGKHKSKKSHFKDMKISSNEMIAREKFGEKDLNSSGFRVSLDHMRWHKYNTSNIPESCCTVRTMSYQNSSKMSFSSCISPSEHTLKWLDENFGPGSKNTTVIVSDEHEEFPDYSILDVTSQTQNCDCNRVVEIEQQNEETSAVYNKPTCTDTNDNASALNYHDNDLCKNGGNDKPIELESKGKIESDVNNNNEKKTVRVVSFKKSRTLKSSSSNSTQKQFEEQDTNTDPLQEMKQANEEKQIDVSSESIKVQTKNIENRVHSEELVEALETISNDLKQSSENTVKISDNQPKQNIICNENICNATEVETPSKPTEQITECDIIPSPLSSAIKCEKPDDRVKPINLNNDTSGIEDNKLDIAKETKSKFQNSRDQSTKTKDCSAKKQENQKIETYATNLNLQNENIFGILRAQEKRNISQTPENIDVVKKENNELNQECKKELDEKIVLKLNDKVMTIDDHSNKDYNRNINMKVKKISKISDPEVIKKRHEELEKDYIMTRLELALNTKVIEKPEMAKYIMEKSQEVIQDFMEKTNENITKKLLAQNDIGGKNRASDSSVQNSENNSVINQKRNDESTTKIDDPIKNTESIPEIMVKHLQNPPNMSLVSDTKVTTDNEHVMNRSNRRDLNNISKIENVKIYRKENKVKPIGGNNSHISINSIDNIMQNKNLLLEEIKSLKRGNSRYNVFK